MALKEYHQNPLLESYIHGMANHNKESLINFYETTKTNIYGYILSIIKNPNDAEDLLQEVYIKVYENSPKYEAHGKPLAWVLVIAKNLCYSHIRRQKTNVDITEMYDLQSIENISNDIENKLIINSLFTKISDEERNIIVLYNVTGLKHKEIAKLLNLPLSTVLSKYNRAIKKLKNILKEDIK